MPEYSRTPDLLPKKGCPGAPYHPAHTWPACSSRNAGSSTSDEGGAGPAGKNLYPLRVKQLVARWTELLVLRQMLGR